MQVLAPPSQGFVYCQPTIVTQKCDALMFRNSKLQTCIHEDLLTYLMFRVEPF